MRALVTGAAGFIGSHLCEVLVESGAAVGGVDSFNGFYAPGIKRANVAGLASADRFTLVEGDLCDLDLRSLVDDVDVVFHLAGQPGVRRSWADDFDRYLRNNVLATQRILDASLAAGVERFVYASSSSVYGEAEVVPTPEDHPTRPRSPYGVTKLAGEHLAQAYAASHGMATVALRYFTVYGPRQRPDMAIHRLIDAAMGGEPFPVFGDGGQRRDFTYVGDIARATVAAGAVDLPPGMIVNAAGGSSVTLAEVIDLVGEVVGEPVPVTSLPRQPGDVSATSGSIERAADLLGWAPEVGFDDGVRQTVRWWADRPAGVDQLAT